MIEKIAYYQGIKDEEPNIRLAEELAAANDSEGISEIVNGLKDKNEQIAHDCIKVLYEIGYRKPELIAPYTGVFIKCLNSRRNRMIWGSAIALAQIAPLAPDELFMAFDAIYQIYQAGSVITVDNCISIFAGIASSQETYHEKIFPVILEHLRTCRPKEVGQHAERAFICVNEKHAAEFKTVLEKRYDSLTESQQKRVERLMKKMEKSGWI